MGQDGVEFRLDILFENATVIPARHQLELKLAENLAGRARAREFSAELGAATARFFGLRKANFKRGIAAQGGNVVVRPCYGIDADLDVHGRALVAKLR
jgi:hypothetical protein